jgi:HK97 family phage major capsid protein
MSKELDMQSLHEALAANRKAYEDGAAEAKTVYKKTEEVLEKYEEKNQKLVAELAATRKATEEFKEKFVELEAKMTRPGLAGKSEEYSLEKKAFESFLRKGKDGLMAEETKALNTESGPDGGFLVPTELSSEILKKVIEISDVASVARVRKMGKLFRQPIRSTIPTVYRTGEMQSTTASQSRYEDKELVAKTLTAEVHITRQELEDAAYDMASQIAEDVAIAIAQKNGEDFVNGVGSPTTPQGFMSAPGIESFNSGIADYITADSLIKITGQLKVGYKPMYAFNRRTRASIRQLKDSVGNYLWVAGNLGGKIPNELNGYPYIEFINMPDIGAGTYPVIFGDFYRGYMIGERQGLFVLRDDYTLASQNIVRFLFNMRNDGLVTLDEAFKKIKCSV